MTAASDRRDAALALVETARVAADEAAKSRDEAIRRAAKVASVRVVATAAGLSAARVHQIVHGR